MRNFLTLCFGPPPPESVVLYLVPSIDDVNGGMISIFSMCKESRPFHPHPTHLCNYPDSERHTSTYTKFPNNEYVFSFEQIRETYPNPDKVMIHLPEYMAGEFLDSLSKKDQKWIQKASYLHLNILNQNIEYMPDIDAINRLKAASNLVTMTTAHHKYSTQAVRDQFQIPLHMLTTFGDPKGYTFTALSEKKNRLVYSPDEHPQKTKILEQISRRLPNLELREIKNLTYDEYKALIADSKFAMTFGEGFDGYFIEPYFSGSISFAVYNENFFPDKSFLDLVSVAGSYDEMIEKIVAKIQQFQDDALYVRENEKGFEMFAALYSIDRYRGYLKAFYEGNYTFP